jgi:hypothetical protein
MTAAVAQMSVLDALNREFSQFWLLACLPAPIYAYFVDANPTK